MQHAEKHPTMSRPTRSTLVRYVTALLVLATLTGFSFLVVRTLISDMRDTEAVIAEASDLRSDIHKTMLALDGAKPAAHSEILVARAQAEMLRSRLDRVMSLLTQARMGPDIWAIVRSETGLERNTRMLIERGSAFGNESSHAGSAHGHAAMKDQSASHSNAHEHTRPHSRAEGGLHGHSTAMMAVDELIDKLRESARANQTRAGLIHDMLGAGILLILLIEAAIIFWPLLRTAEAETRRAETATHELEYLACHDALTGLLNRAQIDSVLKVAVQEAASTNQQLGLILLDLDEFKPVNDTLGHPAGDAVLVAVAERIRSALRPQDIAGRLGGDEFIVVLPEVQFESEVRTIAESILAQLSAPVVYEGRELAPRASIGYAMFPIAGSDVDALMSAADLAMYSAKRTGRGRISEFSGADAERS